MKGFWQTAVLCLCLCACASTASVDSFYERNKEEDGVLAFRVTPVMFSMLGGLSPDIDSFIGNTKDLRFIRLPLKEAGAAEKLNLQVSAMNTGSFVEIFRKNQGDQRNLVSIRERRGSVREILVYNTGALNGSLLYVRGRFDPAKIRDMARDESFSKLSTQLSGAFAPVGISE
jgi:hypothetical protein